jgi:AraC-like DNA-binding protein
MQDQLNSIKYTSTIVPDDIRKNMLMKKALVFVQAKEEHPELSIAQLCKMIGISDSSLKRIMKDLNIKSFYRHEVPVNKKNRYNSQ